MAAADSTEETFLVKKAVQFNVQFADDASIGTADDSQPPQPMDSLQQLTPATLNNHLISNNNNHQVIVEMVNQTDESAPLDQELDQQQHSKYNNNLNNNSSLASRRFLRVRPASASSLSSIDKEYPTWAGSKEARSSLIQVLSALYAMFLVILALAFEVSIVVVDSGNTSKYDVFYIYLYGAALVFFAYCYAFLLQTEGWNVSMPWSSVSLAECWCWTKWCGGGGGDGGGNGSINMSANAIACEAAAVAAATQCDRRMVISLKRKATHSAKSAGSLYLRLGCVVFGVIGLIDKGLRLFVAFDGGISSKCFQGTTVAETFLLAAFIFVQMFFIFQNSKLIIHRFKSTGRLGTMHVIATNLCMWIRSLVEEEYTVIQEIREGVSLHAPRHSTISSSNEQPPELAHPTSNFTSVSPRHCMLDQIMNNGGRRNELDSLIADIKPFMTTCIIEYSLICSAVMYILWRNIGHVPAHRRRQRKQRFHVDCSSSTKGLFLGLLFMVFTIVAMIIFFTKIRSEQNYAALWIFYAWDAILHVVSTLALLVGITRIRRLHYVPTQRRAILLDDILLIVGLLGQLMYCIFSVVPLNNGTLTASMIVVTSLLRMVEVLLQTVFIIFGQRLAALSPRLQSNNPGRETITFLLLTNLSMFITNTFETQKAAANPLTSEFYGESIWTVIVHSTVPLSIFYRFHSTVCLAEIWKEAYRMKSNESPLLG